MKKKADNYAKVQHGLAIWQGSAPHIGRTFKPSSASFPVRASEHDKHFDLFTRVDVWNYDGWLITSSSHVGGIVRCNVRRGTQVAHLVVPEDTLFFHNDPTLPYEAYSLEPGEPAEEPAPGA
ncbi:hypothetical protein D3C72_183360 [compost metagenome]